MRKVLLPLTKSSNFEKFVEAMVCSSETYATHLSRHRQHRGRQDDPGLEAAFVKGQGATQAQSSPQPISRCTLSVTVAGGPPLRDRTRQPWSSWEFRSKRLATNPRMNPRDLGPTRQSLDDRDRRASSVRIGRAFTRNEISPGT